VLYRPVDATTLSAGVGTYAQAPTILQVAEETGNPALGAVRAIHYGVGVEQTVTPAWLKVSLQLFVKTLDRVVEPSEDHVVRDGVLVPERYNSDGRGRVFGMELLVRLLPDHFVYGWLAYTLSRSERWSERADRWIAFDYDQTHVLTLLVGFQLPKRWNVSLRFRVATGNPYSAVETAVFDADYGAYVPIYETVPSKRLPTFHQLDLRVDKTWEWSRIRLKLYLDITNVYYAKNAEFAMYNYDYSKREYVYGLPIIPSVGFQIAFKVPPKK
jgi:hypothetical protein